MNPAVPGAAPLTRGGDARPPRVLHFIETDGPGGAESVLLDLCRGLSDSYAPVVASFGCEWLEARCLELGLEHRRAPAYTDFKRTWRLPRFAARFAAWLRREHVDLVHSHLFGPALGAGLAAPLAGIPHVATLHDVYMVEEAPWRIQQLRLVGALGTRFVTVSEHMRHFYEGFGVLKPERLHTIYNGIVGPRPAEGIDPWPPDDRAAPRLRLLVVGRLVTLKRVDDVLAALAQVPDTCRPYLVVVGDGPERARLEDLARRREDLAVAFVGQCDDVTNWMTHADMFLQVSETEGLSRSILEALAHGLPCVVTEVGGNRELVSDGENGVLTRVGDIEGIASAIERLCVDPDLRRSYAREARRRSAERFGMPKAIAEHGRLYDRLLARAAGPFGARARNHRQEKQE